ncbi:helix-turn-helix transcriptional regulator [Kitasatospora sp. NPDC002227]|uniref:helix-turn-helix transcriptional regulator n=1 Tax=Kitasatospora sp. NPDC002227 TaxID=3154773 RepID=UPI003330FC06
MAPTDLSHLGVSAEEERVYRAMLRAPGTGPEALALDTALEEKELRNLLGCLLDREMVKFDDLGQLRAVDPLVVLERLIETRLARLQEELQQVLSSRHATGALLAEQQEGQRNSASDSIERVEGIENIRTRIDELAFFAHHEVLSVLPGGPLSAAAIGATREADLRALRRGTMMRSIMRRDALEDQQTAEYLRELAGRGAQIRTLEGPLERMLIFDRKTALVPADPQDTSRGALIVHQAGMLSGLLALFERFWASADDLCEERLTEFELELLQTMVRVDKDEVGARELDIAVRTYRGHVAQLLRRLGVSNRVQAALAARDRGWI